MTELKILLGQITRGNYDEMKEALEVKLPKDAKLYIDDEPYCHIQGKQAIRTFELVINHPQFVFDDLFIARQLYFSAPASRDVVMNHRKFQKILETRPHFIDYFYERYGPHAERTHAGIAQRYYQAENAIKYWKKQRNRRLVFFLYPALVKYTRNFRERYYAPGAPGYVKAFKHFTETVHENTCLIVSE